MALGLKAGGWGAACGCFNSISSQTSGQGVDTPLDVRAMVALLQWPSCTACLAHLSFTEKSLWPSQPAWTKIDHHLSPQTTGRPGHLPTTCFRISYQRNQCPEAGLASKHLATIKSLVQRDISAGSSQTADKLALSILAHWFLAPFGTCWRVGMQV